MASPADVFPYHVPVTCAVRGTRAAAGTFAAATSSSNDGGVPAGSGGTGDAKEDDVGDPVAEGVKEMGETEAGLLDVPAAVGVLVAPAPEHAPAPAPTTSEAATTMSVRRMWSMLTAGAATAGSRPASCHG